MSATNDSAEKEINEVFKTIDQFLSQKPLRKNLEVDVNKELKKIKKFFMSYLASLT